MLRVSKKKTSYSHTGSPRLFTADMEQIVPSCSSMETTAEMEAKYPTNQDGVRLFELFTGDDIFAHHEE